MDKELVTGDMSALLSALGAAPKLAIDEHGEVTVSTDTSEIDALRAEMNAERDQKLWAVERDRVLHLFQAREYAMGAWHYMLGSNIYGWSVGESLRSNMGGGRWAQTPRGYTLAEAIAWGCEAAQRRNVRFSFRLARLPEDVQSAVRALVASR
jgi:hypothetical protein